MKKLWLEHKFVLIAYLCWCIALQIISWIGRDWWQIQFKFLSSTLWANFDGVHYVGIATSGYGQYQQAFFPLYPLCIALIHRVFGISAPSAGLIISYVGFLAGLLALYRYVRIYGEDVARWTVILLLTFPTSFYFASVYTESLYFLLAVWVLTLARKNEFLFAAIVAAACGATRLIGMTLMPILLIAAYRKRTPMYLVLIGVISALGILGFMGYLWFTTGDPLTFIHVQPFFGANRSGSPLILLPQVLWRYIKIVITASPNTLQYWVALFEAGVFISAIALIAASWKDRALRPLLVYSALVLLIPSMTGTLSSMPRYVLGAFPLFILLAKLHNIWIKRILTCCFVIGLVVCTSLYLSGYFIA